MSWAPIPVCTHFCSRTMKPVELTQSYLLLNHGPVTLVSSAHNGQRNVMAASWVMPLDFDPPKVAVVIDRNTLTRTLIEGSGSFVLSIPTKRMAEKVLAVGAKSGRDVDKFAAYEIACVFRRNWTVIPRQTGQSFQSKLDSRSVATRGFVFYSKDAAGVN